MIDKNKLLIISSASTSNSGPRGIQVERLLNALSDYFEIILITSSKSVPQKDSYFADKNIKIYTVPETRAGIQKYIRRLWGFLSVFDVVFFVKSYFLGRVILRDERIGKIFCISVAYSNILSGVLLKKMLNRNVQLISFYSDPITNNPYRKSNYFLNMVVSFIERILIEKSDKNIFPSLKMLDYFKIKYPGILENFFYIPHAYTPVCLSSKTFKDEKFTVRYLGTLNKERNPFELINYIRENEEYFKKRNLSLEFYGRYSKSIINKIKDVNCDLIMFNDSVPYSKTKDLHESADALLVIDANFKESMFLPSKLVEVMAFNKPIIILTSSNSESEYIGNKTNNQVILYSDLSKFKNVIEELIDSNRSYSDYSEYSIDSVVLKYKELLLDI